MRRVYGDEGHALYPGRSVVQRTGEIRWGELETSFFMFGRSQQKPYVVGLTSR